MTLTWCTCYMNIETTLYSIYYHSTIQTILRSFHYCSKSHPLLTTHIYTTLTKKPLHWPIYMHSHDSYLYTYIHIYIYIYIYIYIFNNQWRKQEACIRDALLELNSKIHTYMKKSSRELATSTGYHTAEDLHSHACHHKHLSLQLKSIGHIMCSLQDFKEFK